jgi:hypothetical protein
VVESEPLQDGSQDPVAFGKCFAVAEAQYMETVRAQRCTALSVSRHGRRLIVLTAIQLDDEPRFDAGEVGKVAADRVLAAEFVAVETSIPQALPDRAFGVG